MEVNKTEPDLSRDELVLDEPHFDEESTILSARPVVPLEVVQAKSRSVRNLLIGSAIVVALLIGAFGATFVYKLRAQRQAGDVTVTDDSAFESQPSLEAGIAGMESQEPEPIVESQEPELTALDKKQPDERAANKKIPATSPPMISREPRRIARTGIKLRKQDELIEEDLASQRELNQEIRRAERREERREDRREERRARRVEEAKHPRRDRDSRATDDLSRIREIFEGRPKP